MTTRLINPQFANPQKTQIIADEVDEANQYLHKRLLHKGSTEYDELLLLKPSAPAGYVLTASGELVPGAELAALQLNEYKIAAFHFFEQVANAYHARVVGTTDKSREARFALNLDCAKKMLAGTATVVEQQMLQLQYDANKAANHPVISKITLQQFAQWIVNFEQVMTLGAGLIEATLIKGRAAVNAATSIDEIEQIKAQLATQAQTAFEQLQARLSS